MAGLNWHPSALDELDDIARFIAQDSPRRAAAFVQRVYSVVERLNAFPLSGRIVPECDHDTVRELLVGNYRVVYRLSKDHVTILAVRHGARLLDDLPDP